MIVLPSSAPPPQPPNTLRIDRSSSSSNNSVRLTMNFDPSFSEENKVEKYCIRSQNQACPNDSCVTAGGSYTCDGLETGVEYNFTVRAINCRDQESSETEVITVTPQSKLSFIVQCKCRSGKKILYTIEVADHEGCIALSKL